MVDLMLDQLANSYKSAVCAGAADCHRAETDAECIATTDAEFDDLDLKAYIENGTIKFHPENVDACIASFSGLPTCSFGEVNQVYSPSAFSAAGFAQFKSACKAVFEGTVADGGTCFHDRQCVSGDCAKSSGCQDGCSCPGACATVPPPPLAKIGESCALGADGACEPGAFCLAEPSWPWLDPDQIPPPICAAKMPDDQYQYGAYCWNIDACIAPAVCNRGLSGFSHCEKPAAQGDGCGNAWQYPCDRLDEYCDEPTHKCTLNALPGEACLKPDSSSACVKYAFCDWTTGTCAKRLAEGVACTGSHECQGDLVCTNGKCAFKQTPICQ